MLQIINSQERDRAFGKFIFLFLLTMAVIAIAVYFNLKIPLKTNAVLTNHLATFQNREAEQQKLTAVIDSTKTLIDSLGQNKSKDFYLSILIGKKLKEMTGQPQSNSRYSDMNKIVFNTLYDYNEVKTRLTELQTVQEQVDKLKSDLKQCERERDEAKRNEEYYRKAANLDF